jgi:RimJ/RimL family protein N-acetyltransferase
MRASRAVHRRWSTPPLDLEAWAALLARNRRDGGSIVGYEGSVAYGGRNLMGEGLALMLRHAFQGQRLHRVEANVQPGNVRSRALVERAGFRQEGYSPRYLKIGGRWRDHERWAITVEDWRALSRAQ